MASSSRFSKASTVSTRSVNECARLINTATLPGGTRSRTHAVHGTMIGTNVRQRGRRSQWTRSMRWFALDRSSRYAMRLCPNIAPRSNSTAACCYGPGSAARRSAWGSRPSRIELGREPARPSGRRPCGSDRAKDRVAALAESIRAEGTRFASSRTTMCVQLHCEDWNDLPLSITLHDATGALLTTTLPSIQSDENGDSGRIRLLAIWLESRLSTICAMHSGTGTKSWRSHGPCVAI